MRDPAKPSALLANRDGAHLPPLALGIAARFQFCVDAGAAAATDLLATLPHVVLHDHIAFALRSFEASVSAGMAAAGDYDQAKMRACNDAFTAGYQGRLQQELMHLRGATQRHATPSAYPAAMGALNTIN